MFLNYRQHLHSTLGHTCHMHEMEDGIISWSNSQLNLFSHFSPFSLFLKEHEQGRTRERNWRLEVKVEDEVKTCNPRPSSHQAQLILISWSWLAHELSSQLVGNFSQTLISIFHACMDHGVWWHFINHKGCWYLPSRKESKVCSISHQGS